MARHGRLLVPFRLIALLVMLVPLLAACGDDEENDISWRALDEAPAGQPNADVAAAPTGVGGLTAPLPTVPATPVSVSPDTLLMHRPNELGAVPILEYHAITTNPEEEAQFVRTADDMRADLQWLYEHDFYIVPLQDVVNNTISVPAGKHPVALTFDDGTSSQFSFIENEQGELIPDPDTAIGILEEFSKAHPDFGRGGHFGLLVFNAFAIPDISQEPYFEQKIQWMAERGYEIGNHTWQHTNLTDITTEEFMMTVAEPMIWANEVLGDHPANASEILTLPYGTTPDGELHPDQRQMMRDGFTYKGQEFQLDAALLVGADPAYSPASSQWDPMWIPRIQMFDESTAYWFGQFETGEVVLYTSDGDASTVVVPNPLPGALEGHLDEAALTDAGKQVVHYHPETGQVLDAAGDPPAAVTTPGNQVTRRSNWGAEIR